MNSEQPSRTMIGIRTAMLLYTLLVIASFVTLKGAALIIALVIVLGLAVKSLVHYLRNRLE